jgi:hypothetical protein
MDLPCAEIINSSNQITPVFLSTSISTRRSIPIQGVIRFFTLNGLNPKAKWLFSDYSCDSEWLCEDEEIPRIPRKTIDSEQRTISVIWRVSGIHVY